MKIALALSVFVSALALTAQAKTISLGNGESLKGSELQSNDVVTCGAAAPKKALCGKGQTAMKTMGNCAVCMGNAGEGSTYFWVYVSGSKVEGMHTGIDSAIQEMRIYASRGTCY